MADVREIEARITGPGGLFEVVTEDVRGAAMRVFKNRTRSLRALLEASRAHGDKEYIVYQDERISYAQHFARAAAFAHALRERYGVKQGDRVAILAANRPEWVIAFWAAVAQTWEWMQREGLDRTRDFDFSFEDELIAKLRSL